MRRGVHIISDEFASVIGAVDKQVARATYDGGGQDTFSDKVFLLSRKDDYEGVVTRGGCVPEFWDGMSTNADHIKGSPSTGGCVRRRVSLITRRDILVIDTALLQ